VSTTVRFAGNRKDANIVISTGDILDMRTSSSNTLHPGREVSLDNKQTQLYHRYMSKYGCKLPPNYGPCEKALLLQGPSRINGNFLHH